MANSSQQQLINFPPKVMAWQPSLSIFSPQTDVIYHILWVLNKQWIADFHNCGCQFLIFPSYKGIIENYVRHIWISSKFGKITIQDGWRSIFYFMEENCIPTVRVRITGAAVSVGRSLTVSVVDQSFILYISYVKPRTWCDSCRISVETCTCFNKY